MLPDRIAAIIIREKKILLETGTGPNFFWTPGGKVESEESHNETLARELQEELQVTLKSMENYISYKTVNEVSGKEQLVHCYLADFEGNLKPSEEIKEYGWFSKQELLDGKPLVSKGIEKNLIPKLIDDGLI